MCDQRDVTNLNRSLFKDRVAEVSLALHFVPFSFLAFNLCLHQLVFGPSALPIRYLGMFLLIRIIFFIYFLMSFKMIWFSLRFLIYRNEAALADCDASASARGQRARRAFVFNSYI